MKHCSKCHVEKELDAFSRHAGKPDGRRSMCRECIKQQPSRQVYVCTAKKYCADCQTWKPATTDYFYRHAHRRDGLSGRCKICQTLVDSVRRRGKYSEQKNRYRRRRRQEDPIFAERLRQQWRAWAIAHPRRLVSNAAKVSLRMNRASIEKAFAYWAYRCAICGRAAVPGRLLALDHWIPLSRGGPSIPTNRVPLCHGIDGCNNSKADKDPWLWLEETLGHDAAKKKIEAITTYFATCGEGDRLAGSVQDG